MNPMIRKELWLHMRERRGWLLLTIYLLVLASVVVFVYHETARDFSDNGLPSREPAGSDIGKAMFLAVSFTQLALLLLLAPVYSAGRLTIEKEQQTMVGLLTSLLTPYQIWWGKYAASMLFLLLLLFSSVPVLGMAFALGGVGPVEVLQVLGMTLLIISSVCAVGLYCSSLFRRSLHSTALCYGTIAVLTAVTAIVMAMLNVDPSIDLEEGFNLTRAIWQLNPFYAMSTLVADANLKPDVWPCTLLYLAMALLASALCLRHLRHPHDQM